MDRNILTESSRLFSLLWQVLFPRRDRLEKLIQSPEEKVVFLTGATSGIGLSIAKRLVQTHHKIVLTGRKNSLKTLENEGIFPREGRLLILPLDVSKADERSLAMEMAINHFGRLDVLIHNAGIAARSPFESLSEITRQQLLDINYIGPIELTKLALPHLKESRGKIIFHSSAIAFVSCPFKGAYAASKHALDGEVESIYYELKKIGIQVSLFESGVVASNAYDKMILPEETKTMNLAQRERFLFLEKLIRLHLKLTKFTPDIIATKMVALIDRPRLPLRIKGTYDTKIFSWVKFNLPDRLYLVFMERLTTPIQLGSHQDRLGFSVREAGLAALLALILIL